MAERAVFREFASTHTDDMDHTLDQIDKARHRKAAIILQDPYHGLAGLDRLPLELIHHILLELDLRSLIDFRCVNRRARRTTDSLPEFKRIWADAPAAIRCSLNIQTARFFSCADLYRTLSTAACDKCGDFGGYLYLITCRRVCYLCFTEAWGLDLLLQTAREGDGPTAEDLARVPHMRVVPGSYTPKQIECGDQLTWYDNLELRRMNMKFGRRGHSNGPMIIHSVNGDPSHCNTRRFYAVIRAPVFGAQEMDWGFHCVACRDHEFGKGRPFHWRQKYSQSSYQDHIRKCGEIVEGRHVAPTQQ